MVESQTVQILRGKYGRRTYAFKKSDKKKIYQVNTVKFCY